MENLKQFVQAWNEKHPELPAYIRNSSICIPQNKFPYGNIEVEVHDGSFEVYVSEYDGEEMEMSCLGSADTVEEAIGSAECGVHPGDVCAVCGKKMEWWYESRKNFVKYRDKLYCLEHKPNR